MFDTATAATIRGESKRELISTREAAERLGISEQVIYRARKRGTIAAAQGPDVPQGVWFEETEVERWAAHRKRLGRLGRRPGGSP